MIWSKNETLSRGEYEEIQLERLKDTLTRIYENVPYYKEKLHDCKVSPNDLNLQVV